MASSYVDLLKPDRHRPSRRKRRSLIEEALSDRARVVFSAAFRRLQGKAQVFPLDPNAAVRTRLTHSLEVAHVGRTAAIRALKQIPNRAALGLDAERGRAFVEFVETACLLHDIGNPPFGHFGEHAIQRWFTRRGEQAYWESRVGVLPAPLAGQKPAQDVADTLLELSRFDGNPHGFRIVASLQSPDDEYGLNLTYSQLAASLKYPNGLGEASIGRFGKRLGYFNTESEVVGKARGALGLAPGQRHPLAYLMEAADDIAYCISDIEDGIEKGLVREEFAVSEILSLWDEELAKQGIAPRDSALRRTLKPNARKAPNRFFAFKVDLIARLVPEAASRFVDRHAGILAGNEPALFDDAIVAKDDHLAALETLKRFAKKHLFRSREAESMELAGLAVVSGILETYAPLLECNTGKLVAIRNFISSGGVRPKQLDVELRLYNRLPPKHRAAYGRALVAVGDPPTEAQANDEWCARARMVADYVAGMTDQFALEEYQRLSGIRVV